MRSTAAADRSRRLSESRRAMPQIPQRVPKRKGPYIPVGTCLGTILLSLWLGQGFLEGQSTNAQINVNWLYGSFVPRDVPLEPLDGRLRWNLYIRQTYTTPGIYVKTTLFTVHDQVHNAIPEWGGGIQGFATRFASREGQFIIQNSVTSLGFAAVGWEPRYDRCRCDGFWPRTRHAIARNFVTYDKTGASLRPQIVPYLGAFCRWCNLHNLEARKCSALDRGLPRGDYSGSGWNRHPLSRRIRPGDYANSS